MFYMNSRYRLKEKIFKQKTNKKERKKAKKVGVEGGVGGGGVGCSNIL